MPLPTKSKRKPKTQFRLFESNTQTKLTITIKDYSENGKDNYNYHWEYKVELEDKSSLHTTYTVFSDLYYSVWNEQDECDFNDKFQSYWPISIIPRPLQPISNLIRAAIMFVYYEDDHCNCAQEVSDWFEDRDLFDKFDFEPQNEDTKEES